VGRNVLEKKNMVPSSSEMMPLGVLVTLYSIIRRYIPGTTLCRFLLFLESNEREALIRAAYFTTMQFQ
jgi:hypothetical protein